MDILTSALNECFRQKYINKYPHHFISAFKKDFLKEDLVKNLPEGYIKSGQPVILDPEFKITYHSMECRFVRDCVEKIVNSISTEVDI